MSTVVGVVTPGLRGPVHMDPTVRGIVSYLPCGTQGYASPVNLSGAGSATSRRKWFLSRQLVYVWQAQAYLGYIGIFE